MFIDFLKTHPPLESTLVLLVPVGVLALWALRKTSRVPALLLIAVLLVYAGLSTPFGSEALAFGLGYGFTPIRDAGEARGADTIVILGSGVRTYRIDQRVLSVVSDGSALRALEAARLYHLVGARLVIASGGMPFPEYSLRPESEAIRAAVVAAGVPAERVIEESKSRTTRDEARILAPLLKARGAKRFLLVTSATHMRRSLAVFHAEGLEPIPAIAPVRSDHLPPLPVLLPNDESRHLSDGALYDYAATMYYWWEGWLK